MTARQGLQQIGKYPVLRKLGAATRRDAVRRASELQLLTP